MTANPTHVVLRDPSWLPYSFDDAHGTVDFVRLSRARRGELSFLDNRHIVESPERVRISLAEIESAFSPRPDAPGRFIFQTALCCSTLLARALDSVGNAMSLREPHVLVSLAHEASSVSGDQLRSKLGMVLSLLERPLVPGEAVIIKPGNTSNAIAGLILELRPRSKAILLYRPLAGFLSSLAAKGRGGRIWARQLASFLERFPNLTIGFEKQDLATLGDFHVAAHAWLLQQAEFARLLRDQPGDRVAALDSESFLSDPSGGVRAASDHFELGIGSAQIEAIVSGPVFARHSKRTEAAFDPAVQEWKRAAVQSVYGREIEAAIDWAHDVAADAGVPMRLESALLH